MIGELLYLAHRLRRPLIMGLFGAAYWFAALATQMVIGR
jgi:hypothetical protein